MGYPGMHEYENSNRIPYGHTHCHVKSCWIVFHHSHPDLEHLIGEEQQLGHHPQSASWRHLKQSRWLDSEFFVCIYDLQLHMISFLLQESCQEMKYFSHSLHRCFVLSKVRTTKACCSFCLSRFLQLFFPQSISDFVKALKCQKLQLGCQA